ncbi:MAG: hypothetical protein ACLP52_01240 [Streptosporangiaceae bacterium]
MTSTGDWAIDYRAGGWARAQGSGVTVYLKLGIDSDRRRTLHICAATLTADRPVTESVWRSVPLSEVSRHLAVFSYVTSPDTDRLIETITQPTSIDGFSIEALERYFAETEPLPVHGTIPSPRTLRKPPGGRLTGEFLRDMAGLYLSAIADNKAPAPVIAEATGVPVRTVHRWVAEARNRDILPPATKGRAG